MRAAAAVQAVRAAGDTAVLTHGDAGPGNFLDHPAGGIVIDFEAACLQPAAADLGRALFLADVESGIQQETAAALLHGYETGAAVPTADAQTLGQAVGAWRVVEGLRIVRWRHEHREQDSTPPWQAALDGVRRALEGLPC